MCVCSWRACGVPHVHGTWGPLFCPHKATCRGAWDTAGMPSSPEEKATFSGHSDLCCMQGAAPAGGPWAPSGGGMTSVPPVSTRLPLGCCPAPLPALPARPCVGLGRGRVGAAGHAGPPTVGVRTGQVAPPHEDPVGLEHVPRVLWGSKPRQTRVPPGPVQKRLRRRGRALQPSPHAPSGGPASWGRPAGRSPRPRARPPVRWVPSGARGCCEGTTLPLFHIFNLLNQNTTRYVRIPPWGGGPGDRTRRPLTGRVADPRGRQPGLAASRSVGRSRWKLPDPAAGAEGVGGCPFVGPMYLVTVSESPRDGAPRGHLDVEVAPEGPTLRGAHALHVVATSVRTFVQKTRVSYGPR